MDIYASWIIWLIGTCGHYHILYKQALKGIPWTESKGPIALHFATFVFLAVCTIVWTF